MIKNITKIMNKKTRGFMNNSHKHLSICIFLLLLFLGVQQQVNAQIVSSAQVKSDVAKFLENSYKLPNADVEVKVTATQFANLQLPDGKITYKVAGGNDKITPRDIKRIELYVNGILNRTLNLPVQTNVYKNVLVASDIINRDQILSKECTETKRMNVVYNLDYVLSEAVLDKEVTSKKMFQKGDVLDKRFVKMRPDVARNSDVRIYFVSNGSVMITIDGTAMADGMFGDYVNVENRNYKKVYNGKVIGENKVLVNI